jgi:Vacuolar sorting-associated protein 13, N-terminal
MYADALRVTRYLSLTRSPCSELSSDVQPHSYICQSLNAEVRVRQSDRQRPGPLSCSADVLPFEYTFNIRPHQYLQYQRLQRAIKSQLHFDTMFRQRPAASPRENARAWWRYAIGCVTSRPNSRPWDDVLTIARSRNRYIELVAKKNKKPLDGNGFHGCLSDSESDELLALEDLLPIEALETFHLLALRQAYELQKSGDLSADRTTENGGSGTNGESGGQWGRSNPFRILGRGGRQRRRRALPIDESTSGDAYQRIDQSPRPVPPSSDEVPRQNTISLLEAMTLRLGKKTYFILWNLHDANVNLVLLGTRGTTPLAHAVLRSSGVIRSFGKAKRDFSFDIMQFDIFHRDDRVMFLRSPIDECLSEGDSSDTDRSVDGDSTEASTLSLEDSVIGAPDLVTSSRFLPLPARGIVCRLAAGKDVGKLTVSLAAHPATLIWTTALYDSLAEFLNVRSTEEQDDIALTIRNAATPLARKAQLALLSPASVSLHLNVSAPKIWIPISSQDSSGSLFLDAGTVKVACIKEEGETDMQWDVQSRDIRVNFIRGRSLRFPNDDVFLSHMIETTNRTETSIIRPVHLSIETRNREIYEADGFVLQDSEPALSGIARGVDIVMSPVSLNLVDAEILARVFGKWYGRIVNRVRLRASKTTAVTPKLIESGSRLGEQDDALLNDHQTPRVLTMSVSRLEVALEGHSKSIGGAVDDRSLASQDSYLEVAPPKRTYVFDVEDMAIRQSVKGQVKRTLFSVVDASIVRLRDGAVYSPLKGNRDVSDAQNAILVRATDIPDDSTQTLEILRVSMMHNGDSHLDEVEIDIDSVILRVTPTTLKDCAKAFRRVAEFAQLVTREMERKVHEEGRKARWLDRLGTNQIGSRSTVHQHSLTVLPVVQSDRSRFTPTRQPKQSGSTKLTHNFRNSDGNGAAIETQKHGFRF